MDISALRERGGSQAFSVSELNGIIKNMLDSSPVLSSVCVVGEISNFTNHRSGHLYFSLKDSEGQIKSVMFKGNAQRLKFIPENGMRVIARGSVSVFTRDGNYQLYVSSMQPDGVGALYVAYERLKEKLAEEGLFSTEFKKPIPKYPTKIGVITSPTGAAVRDIINVISRRYPVADIYLYPALVQGESAEASLIEGLDYFDASGLCDTVIIGRGGGSIEDLWAFNGERLARRIFSMSVPVISAVGHETDFTICDFVSDLRAPTPSAAAELAVPDIREIIQRLDGVSTSLDVSISALLKSGGERLKLLTQSAVFTSPENLIKPFYEAENNLREAVVRAYESYLERQKSRFALDIGKLEALNPLAVLKRGYSIASKDGISIKSVDDLNIGEKIKITLSDGEITARAEEIKPTEEV